MSPEDEKRLGYLRGVSKDFAACKGTSSQWTGFASSWGGDVAFLIGLLDAATAKAAQLEDDAQAAELRLASVENTIRNARERYRSASDPDLMLLDLLDELGFDA